ncbi:FtsX-like permease family protein [Streptomyces sp. Ru87]|uniref:FtsX-like permease family protein n=1 Tax=Streptomyces sp. Ru87 TaxID=2044307 RepID=UPI000BF5298B|nr:FtsX-like permease family protein [Streptomyces sp. Ru87]PGH50357.1 hypothetical protein CRI70_12570 [Streptomyces sp. Ru87]
MTGRPWNRTRSAAPRKPSRTAAPWTRTRLRTAPGAALALGALVLVTAFLAALFPRAADADGARGLRQDIASAHPSRSTLDLSTPYHGPEMPRRERERLLSPGTVEATYRELLALLPAPLRADRAQSAYGVQTTTPLTGQDRWLPRPGGLPPEFVLAAQAGLDRHAEVRAGRLPAARAATSGTREIEAAVTTETARSLRIRAGSVVHVGGNRTEPGLTVRVTGVVDPLRPEGSYWSAYELLRTPSLLSTDTRPPEQYWKGALLIAPETAPALLGTLGEPRPYWRIAPDVTGLTARDLPALADRVAWLRSGPGLLKAGEAAGGTVTVAGDLDAVLAAHRDTASAVTAVTAVAAAGTGTAAAVTLALAAALQAARRHSELALLRARGGSLAGIAGRLLAESAAVALPAAAVGLLAAVWLVEEARLLPSVAGAAAVAVLGCAALPVRAVVAHRTVRVHGGREDVVRARPGRRRTVAELTLLALAAGAVVALRRRGAADDGDLLVSAAPVLTGLIAAVVLVRLYPLPLRWLARPAGRLRGALGFLALARSGREPSAGTLPLLVVLVALASTAFGGAVLAGVADARDRAALEAVGADARISAPGGAKALPEGLAGRVREVPGVRAVAPVLIEYAVDLPQGHPANSSLSPTLVGTDPRAYDRFLREQGLGGLPAGGADGAEREAGVLDAVASPDVAEALGSEPVRILAAAGRFTVRVTAVRESVPAVSTSAFLVVDAAKLPRGEPNTLLAAGRGIDAEALRGAVRAADGDAEVALRAEASEDYADSVLQRGAERIFGAAVAAGAGYALLALLLSLLRSAPERSALLARLRTMGLTRRQGRGLLLLEALPQTVPAAVGGVLVGRATVWLLAPGVDLTPLAFAGGIARLPDGGAAPRSDLWSLLVPAAAVVLLSAAVAAAQAWWLGRRDSIDELRAGDLR